MLLLYSLILLLLYSYGHTGICYKKQNYPFSIWVVHKKKYKNKKTQWVQTPNSKRVKVLIVILHLATKQKKIKRVLHLPLKKREESKIEHKLQNKAQPSALVVMNERFSLFSKKKRKREKRVRESERKEVLPLLS